MQWFRGASGSTPPPAKVPQGKALLLIGFNEATKAWEVNPEAVALLQRVSSPLCSLVVCGRARQGKSFLLNTMLGRMTGQDLPEGFKVSPTQHSCTRGLWMWSVPIPFKDADGKPCNLLLIDCEGIDAVDQGQKHSAQIFSLAVLLSSVFVYNQLGAIDAIALERLAMVCELAKRIRERSTAAARGGASAQAYHPAFVWLLRDFQLQLAAGGGAGSSRGGAITPAAYLEEVLSDVRGGQEANRNAMRDTIKAVFPDRDAFTLLRPMLREEDLNRLDTIPFTKLRPEFQKGMDEFMGLLRSKAHPLAVSGQLVSGRVYAQLAEAYVQALNQGAVPQLVTAWQGVARAECQKAYDAALSSFEGSFKEEGCDDDTQLYDRYQAALSSAVRGFKESALGDAALTGEFEERLRKVAEERFTSAREKLRATSERAAEALLAAEQAKLRAMMSTPGANINAIEAELKSFLLDYDSRVSGPWKYKRASEFLMNTLLGIKDIFARVVAEREAAQKKAADAEARATQLRAEAGRIAEAESKAAGTQRELAAVRSSLATAEGQLAARTRELGEVRAEVAHAAGQANESQARERQLQSDVTAARSEVARLKAQLGSTQRAEAEAAQLRSQLQAAQAAAGEARAAADAARAEAVAAESRAAQVQSQLTAVQAQLKTAEATGQEAATLRSQLAEARRSADEARLQVSRTAGEREEERAVANRNLREVTELQAQLLRERERHDEAKEALRGAQGRVRELEQRVADLEAGAAAGQQPVAAAGAAPPAGTTPVTGRGGRGGRAGAASGSQPATGGRATVTPTTGRATKRRRQEVEEEEGGEPMDAEGPGSAPPPPASTARTPASARRRGAAAAAATPATPSTGGPGGTPVVVQGDVAAAAAALPANVDGMSIAALKAFVVEHRLEDEAFMALAGSKAKKADYVAYVKRRVGRT